METTKKTSDLKPGDLVDLDYAPGGGPLQPVKRVTPPVGLTTYWTVETGDSLDGEYHGSATGCGPDREWTVHGTVTGRIRRTPTSLERMMSW